MIKIENFNRLVEQALEFTQQKQMRPVIEKELLHYDILYLLDQQGLLEKLTFQGGTSLRLCYGSNRFSEDLDFSGGKDFVSNDLLQIKTCIEEYIGKRYNLEVSVKEPRELRQDPDYDNINVDKWRITVVSSPERRDMPRQKIKLEIINIPSYTRTPRALQNNYPFLPDGYKEVLINTEDKNEIMADKIISLANCERYIRYRDIWDLQWLKQNGATLNFEFIISKINDYNIKNYNEKLTNRIKSIDHAVFSKEFKQEMSRFIPNFIIERTLLKPNFKKFLCDETIMLFKEVQTMYSESPESPEFKL